MTRNLSRSLVALAGLSLGAVAFAQPNTASLNLSSTTATAQASGTVTVRATVRNTTATSQTLSLGRNNFQECAFAPHVRVLRVGTREVVYPTTEPRICTQELRTETIAGNGELTFERTLDLDPGDYMVEVWVKGFANDAPVFLAGQPVRVNVGGVNSTPGTTSGGTTTGGTTAGNAPTNTPVTPTTPAAANFGLVARAPSTATTGRSFNAVLTVTNKSNTAQRVASRLCPVGIEARSASGERLDLQNIAAVLCAADTSTTTLQPGQSKLYSVSVPAISRVGTYTLTFTTYDFGTATATVTVR